MECRSKEVRAAKDRSVCCENKHLRRSNLFSVSWHLFLVLGEVEKQNKHAPTQVSCTHFSGEPSSSCPLGATDDIRPAPLSPTALLLARPLGPRKELAPVTYTVTAALAALSFSSAEEDAAAGREGSREAPANRGAGG